MVWTKHRIGTCAAAHIGVFLLTLYRLQMHKSYKNLVQKAKTIAQDKTEKQAMLEELRKRAQESSRCEADSS